MFYVYAIYNEKHHKVYVGQTSDITERISAHNNKTFKISYTLHFDGGWKLIYQERTSTRYQALKREKELKSYRGREFIKQFIPR
ncbi:MAG: GIY-YIG nuclease family protein [Candidatus Berkelbacteria bacterium]